MMKQVVFVHCSEHTARLAGTAMCNVLCSRVTGWWPLHGTPPTTRHNIAPWRTSPARNRRRMVDNARAVTGRKKE